MSPLASPRRTDEEPRRRTTVLIVDDYEPLRESLRALLEAADMEVVGEAARGEQATDLAGSVIPDVVLMNLSMPGADGVETTRRLIARSPRSRVLLFTASEDAKRLVDGLRAGAVGCLIKGGTPEELLDSIERVSANQVILTPSIAGRILRSAEEGQAKAPVLEEEHQQLLRLMACGTRSEQRLAHRLGCQVEVVRSLLRDIVDSLHGTEQHAEPAAR